MNFGNSCVQFAIQFAVDFASVLRTKTSTSLPRLFAVSLAVLPALVQAQSSDKGGVYFRATLSPEKAASIGLDRTASVHVLGSVHFGRPDIYPMPQSTIAALEQAQALVVEIDVDAVDLSKVGDLMLAKGAYPSDESLAAKLDPTDWKQLRNVTQKFGIVESSLRRMRPWMAAMTLIELTAEDLGLDSDLGVDLYFIRKARQLNKPVVALETIEEQLAIFWDMPEAEQLTFLRSELGRSEENRRLLADVIEAWKRGDAASIDRQLHDSLHEAGFGRLHHQLVVRRNIRMLTRLLPLIRKHRYLMVVVGAGHVVGDTGLARGLQEFGFEVEYLPWP